MRDLFRKFAHKASGIIGSPAAFAVALLVILAWAAMGPAFHYSDTWQLVINTGTTIVTFLIVFLIQNTQNRDARSIQLKLDELIRVNRQARNELVDIEEMEDHELERLKAEFHELRQHYHSRTESVSSEIDRRRGERRSG
jgi:low affinity Fe/Cu permease